MFIVMFVNTDAHGRVFYGEFTGVCDFYELILK